MRTAIEYSALYSRTSCCVRRGRSLSDTAAVEATAGTAPAAPAAGAPTSASSSLSSITMTSDEPALPPAAAAAAAGEAALREAARAGTADMAAHTPSMMQRSRSARANGGVCSSAASTAFM